MKLKQKWYMSNDYYKKCCFNWVITWKLLTRKLLTGKHPLPSPHPPHRENPGRCVLCQ